MDNLLGKCSEVCYIERAFIKNKNTMEEKQKQAVEDILIKYLLNDCLKPEWDGMGRYEIAEKIVKAVNEIVE